MKTLILIALLAIGLCSCNKENVNPENVINLTIEPSFHPSKREVMVKISSDKQLEHTVSVYMDVDLIKEGEKIQSTIEGKIYSGSFYAYFISDTGSWDDLSGYDVHIHTINLHTSNLDIKIKYQLKDFAK